VGDLTIRIETAKPAPESFARRVEAACRNRLYFHPKVVVVAPGSLPRFEMKANRLIRAAKNPAER
jgi:phenylacetate-coenzyme A ligase PaaK-like adenylate-forming protein